MYQLVRNRGGTVISASPIRVVVPHPEIAVAGIVYAEEFIEAPNLWNQWIYAGQRHAQLQRERDSKAEELLALDILKSNVVLKLTPAAVMKRVLVENRLLSKYSVRKASTPFQECSQLGKLSYFVILSSIINLSSYLADCQRRHRATLIKKGAHAAPRTFHPSDPEVSFSPLTQTLSGLPVPLAARPSLCPEPLPGPIPPRQDWPGDRKS